MKVTDTPAQRSSEQRIPFEKFLKRFGRTRATGHRWRRLLPWLEVENIFGRLYIAASTVQRFEEAAARGELAIHARPPERPQKQTRKRKAKRGFSKLAPDA